MYMYMFYMYTTSKQYTVYSALLWECVQERVERREPRASSLCSQSSVVLRAPHRASPSPHSRLVTTERREYRKTRTHCSGGRKRRSVCQDGGVLMLEPQLIWSRLIHHTHMRQH